MAKIRELMHKLPVKVATTAPVEEAAKQMRNEDVGFVIVEEDGLPYGIVTDRDITVRAVAQGLNPTTTPVASICSKELTTVSPEQDIDVAIQLMRDKALRRVLVVDAERHALGVVSLGDLALVRDERSVLGQISRAPGNL
jgi:CBS domain-containing protein